MRTFVIIVSILFIVTACKKHSVPLAIVRTLPFYFHNSRLYGEDKKRMEEKNEFILATGVIDTTDEFPPVEVAYICSYETRQLVEMKLVRRQVSKNDHVETYSANDYSVTLSSKSGTMMVTRRGQTCIYEIIEQQGYR